MSETPARAAYYPGAQQRYQSLLDEGSSGRVERLGSGPLDALPWTLVRDLEPASNTPLFRSEPFCSILSEVTLAPTDCIEFLETAVAFANDQVWGTLNATLLAPAELERDAALSTALEQSVQRLRYGTVGVNVWPAVGYGLGAPPWGGYPGATLLDVQSGLGWSHNSLLLERFEKVVLRGSLRPLLAPIWEPNNPHLAEIGAALARQEAAPGVGGVLRAAWAALRP
ncbi:MAG: hypothetical protein QM756_32345 [Polyangiaceae bacterium]